MAMPRSEEEGPPPPPGTAISRTATSHKEYLLQRSIDQDNLASVSSTLLQMVWI